jgi:hypothetical protein
MLRSSKPLRGESKVQLMKDRPPDRTDSDPVFAARVAIWRLFQEGYVDEDMATAGLLAVDLGTRRVQRNAVNDPQAHERRLMRRRYVPRVR